MNKPKWKTVVPLGTISARPYKRGESLEGVFVHKYDRPRVGGWIARDPDDLKKKWYINEAQFKTTYEVPR